MSVAAIRRGPEEEGSRQRGATVFCSFAGAGRAYYGDPQCPGQRRKLRVLGDPSVDPYRRLNIKHYSTNKHNFLARAGSSETQFLECVGVPRRKTVVMLCC